MDVVLSSELEKLITARIKTGEYHSASEVIREGLRLLEAEEELRLVKSRALKRDIAAGLEQLDRGEGIPAESVFAAMKKRNKSLRRMK